MTRKLSEAAKRARAREIAMLEETLRAGHWPTGLALTDKERRNIERHLERMRSELWR